MKTKHYIALFMMLCAMIFTSCITVDTDDRVNNNDHSASEAFSYDITTAQLNRLNLTGINGSMKIQAVAGLSTIKVTGKRIVKSDTDADAEEHLADLQVVVSQSNDQLTVKTDQPRENHGRDYIVNYEITVPANWDVVLTNVNGELTIDSLTGDIVIGLVNGSIKIKDHTGNISIGLTNGDIQAKTILPLNGTCQITTVNGEIGLNIPTATSATFSAKLTNGNISVNNLSLKNTNITRFQTNGTLGNGEGKIDLTTVNGTIQVVGY
jgi:hypothetical protein